MVFSYFSNAWIAKTGSAEKPACGQLDTAQPTVLGQELD
jgi:hypothetical protein